MNLLGGKSSIVNFSCFDELSSVYKILAVAYIYTYDFNFGKFGIGIGLW